MSRRRAAGPDVRRYFDEQSSCYVQERYVRPGCEQLSYQNRRRLAVEFLGNGPGRVLDIGSGPGVLSRELLARGYSVWEVDISLEMLRESRRRLHGLGMGEGVRFVEGSLPHLPFADQSFDAAACIGVFAYLNEPTGSLREIRRLLKPGGVLVIQVSNVLCPAARLHSVLRRSYRRLGEALGGRSYPHLRIRLASFRRSALFCLLGQEGFKVDVWGYYDFRPPFLEWMLPSAALATASWLQRFERSSSLGWLAEGLVVRARAW